MNNSAKKNILLVGMPDMALICMARLVADGHNIAATVPPHKSHNTYKLFCDTANSLDLKIVDYEKSLKDKDFIDTLKKLNLDIAVVCSYGVLFPNEFLSVAKDGFINVHPSLLPKYRGANPYSHVILNGEKETGVTLHFMDEHFDTGDIIVQKKVQVFDDDTMGTVFNRLNFLGAEMLSETLSLYEDDIALPRLKQPEGSFVTAPKIEYYSYQTMINWNDSAANIERFIRALNPFIGAITCYRGNNLKIFSAYTENTDSGFPPGTIVSVDNDLAVAAKKGVVHITVLQAGSYFIGQVADFIRLSKCKIGETLE